MQSCSFVIIPVKDFAILPEERGGFGSVEGPPAVLSDDFKNWMVDTGQHDRDPEKAWHATGNQERERELPEGLYKEKPKGQTIVYYTREAAEWINSKGTVNQDDPAFARLAENARRVMVVLAVSKCNGRGEGIGPVIDLEIAQWGYEFSEYLTSKFAADFKDEVADSKSEANINKVRKALREAGEQGLGFSRIIRKTAGMTEKDRSEAVGGLLGMGDIVFGRSPGDGPRTMRYRAIEFKGESFIYSPVGSKLAAVSGSAAEYNQWVSDQAKAQEDGSGMDP